MNDDLAVRSNVRTLVAAFQQAEATVRRAFADIVAAEEAVNLAFGNSDRGITVSASSHWASDFRDADDAVVRMQRSAWETIVDRLELRRVMSIGRYEALQREMSDGKLPPITETNVEAFARQYAGDLDAIFAEAIAEVFEWLRPRRTKHKSNSQNEVPRKVVLTGIVEPRNPKYTTRGYTVHWHVAQKLVALENVFHGLDGQGQTAKDHVSQLQRAIEACPRGEGYGETELFSFSVFDNGNGHIGFRRLDLLARFNAKAGGLRLRAA